MAKSRIEMAVVIKAVNPHLDTDQRGGWYTPAIRISAGASGEVMRGEGGLKSYGALVGFTLLACGRPPRPVLVSYSTS